MVDLNYDPSVPFTTKEGIDITTAAPFVVEGGLKAAPTRGRYCDYIPNPRKVDPPVKPNNTAQRVHTGRVIVRGPDDYVSKKDVDARNLKDKSIILDMAKKLYNEQSKRRKDHKAAKKLLDKVGPEGIANSTPEIERALRIVGKGKPLSKDKAIELARKKYYDRVNQR